jgi:hypothetical protein
MDLKGVAMNILSFLTGKAHVILIAIAAVGLYTTVVYLKGGADRERKIREETKTTFVETVVHDTVYPQLKTMALKPKAKTQRLSGQDSSRIANVIASSDSLQELLWTVLPPFSGWTDDSTLAISKSGKDTVRLHFRIDATADPVTRVIAPLSLALAPFDLPKKETTIKSTVFEGYPWYKKIDGFALGIVGGGGAALAGAKAPVVIGIGAAIFVLTEVFGL